MQSHPSLPYIAGANRPPKSEPARAQMKRECGWRAHEPAGVASSPPVAGPEGAPTTSWGRSLKVATPTSALGKYLPTNPFNAFILRNSTASVETMNKQTSWEILHLITF